MSRTGSAAVLVGLSLISAGLIGCPEDSTGPVGEASGDATGTGGAAGSAGVGGSAGSAGSGGTGGGGLDTAACLESAVAGGDTMECAECVCTMCATELAACVMDTSPAPNPTVTETSGEVCQAIIDCSSSAGCDGDECWCGCTSGEGCCSMGTNYANDGPCKDVINEGASMPDMTMSTGGPFYPGESDKLAGPGHPIGNSGAVGVCVNAKCSGLCQ